MEIQRRTPQGTSAGGQFATSSRSEANLSLTPGNHAHTVGSRYDGADITVIAKAMRTELKTMQKTGEVPADWKVSVRTSRFAGGQAIDVNVVGVSWEMYNDANYGELERPRPADLLALARIDESLAAHNYDNSDSMRDYFDVHFYGNVTADGRGIASANRVCPSCVRYRPCGC